MVRGDLQGGGVFEHLLPIVHGGKGWNGGCHVTFWYSCYISRYNYIEELERYRRSLWALQDFTFILTLDILREKALLYCTQILHSEIRKSFRFLFTLTLTKTKCRGLLNVSYNKSRLHKVLTIFYKLVDIFGQGMPWHDCLVYRLATKSTFCVCILSYQTRVFV